MFDFAFILIWLLLPLFWHILLKAASLSLWRVTIPSFVILSFYIYQYLGLPVLYFQLDEYRYVTGVNDESLVLRVFFYTSLTITLMTFSFVIGRKLFGRLSNPAPAAICASRGSEMFGLSLLFVLCVAVLYKYLNKVGFQNIALLNLLDVGSGVEAEVARSAMGNSFEGKYHWYYLFMNKLMIFSNIAFFLQMLLRPSRYNKILFGVGFLLTTFSMVMAIEKQPMVDYVVALCLTYVLLRQGGNISVKGLIFIGGILIILVSVFYMVFMGAGSFIAGIFSAFSRTLTGQIQPAYHYLEFFPTHQDYLLGRSFPNPMGLLPFEPYRLTVEIMNWYYPELAKHDIVGSMPTAYWGEMYANFGIIGAIIPPFFVGIALYWLNSLLIRFEPSPISIALFIVSVMHFKNLALTSLTGYLVDTYFVFTFIAFMILSFISGHGGIKFRKETRTQLLSGKSY